VAKKPDPLDEELDRLALLLEAGKSLRTCALRMGIAPWRAEYLFGVMQARLGPQAMED
jgi:hypothetical protein